MILLFKLIARLPLWLLRALGLALGWTIWAASPRYRRMMATNWRQALRSGRLGVSGAAAARRLRRDAIGHAGLIATELPKFWCDPTMTDRVMVLGMDQVHEVLDRGQGVILLTPHLGAFELSPRVFALERPITVLYRPARQRSFRRLMETLRPMDRLATAPANAAGVRQLLRALRRGEAVGMLPDQVPAQGEGVWAPFFDRPALTMVLPLRLAQMSGAAIFWALTVRTQSGWRLSLQAWQPDPPIENVAIEVAAAQMNAALEQQIAQAPEQYLWAYNRYKIPRGTTSPLRASQA
ncbi:MAG: lysophospholipid acyltransferase family protein [Burkholderiaceae bacterium]|nr:lysophospholipid acyltransferase family protein [Burkholderiaceae bacterium]